MTPCKHQRRHLIERVGTTDILKCQTCNLVFRLPTAEDLNPKQRYKNFYRNELPQRFLFGVEVVIKLFRFFRSYKIYTIAPTAKRILDIGSGRGFMLHYLRKFYHYDRVAGTQIEKNAYLFSKKNLGLEIYNRDLLKIRFKKNSFDIITMWHILEHVTKPEQYLKKCHYLLRPGGKLIIEVPNFDSWSRPLTKRRWLSWDVKYHLSHFSPKTLTGLVNKYKFRVISIHTFSLEYSAFISAQSIINVITSSDQVFFSWIQSGSGPKPWLHLILFAIILPPCLLINLILYSSRIGEVLLIVAKRL